VEAASSKKAAMAATNNRKAKGNGQNRSFVDSHLRLVHPSHQMRRRASFILFETRHNQNP
jgi:hypothetical protein